MEWDQESPPLAPGEEFGKTSSFPHNDVLQKRPASGYVRGNTDWNHLLWPCTVTCMSYFTTGGLVRNSELTNQHQPGEFEKGQREMPHVLPNFQNPPLWNPSWLNAGCTTRKDPKSEWLAKDNPETNPKAIKPETASHEAEQFSWAPLPYCSPPRGPFPIKSFALSASMSPWTILFRVLGKSPLLGPWKGSPFLQHISNLIAIIYHSFKDCALSSSLLFHYEPKNMINLLTLCT